jgi:biotin carboxylase
VRPRVAVLHHPRSFFPLDLFNQVGDSAELLWVVDEESAGDDTVGRLLRRLGPVADISGLDADQSASAIGAHHPQGIVTFVDDRVEAAAAVAQRLGLVYHPPDVAHTVVDKCLQRAAMDKAGIAGPRYWAIPVGLPAAEVARLIAEVRFPAVLKPAEGSGSRGIRRVEDAKMLLDLLGGEASGHDCLVEEYLYDSIPPEEWMASYLSLESVVSAGRPSHVAITGRFPLAEPFRETGNFLPGIIHPDLEGPVLDMVDRAIEALAITDAVIHTEIKLTPDGPMLIEVNGRLGGRPPFVLRDVSTVNLFQAACRIAVGEPVSFDGLASCQGVGYWLMLQPPMSAERVASVNGLDELAGLDGVETVKLRRRVGEAVDWRGGTESQVLTVRGRTADHRALAGTLDSIRHTVSIGYDCAPTG